MRRPVRLVPLLALFACLFLICGCSRICSDAELERIRESAYNEGYSKGLGEHSEEEQQAIYETAFSEGQAAGYDTGLQAGAELVRQSMTEAVESCFLSGYEVGYDDGFAQKKKDQAASRQAALAAEQAAKAAQQLASQSQPPAADPAPPPEAPSSPAENPNGTVVYITESGKKYHLGSCSHLRKSKIEISLQEAKSRGYTPCGTCKPPQ